MADRRSPRLALSVAACVVIASSLTACGSSSPTPQDLAQRVIDEFGVAGATGVIVEATSSSYGIEPAVTITGVDEAKNSVGGRAAGETSQDMFPTEQPVAPVDPASFDWQTLYDRAEQALGDGGVCQDASRAAVEITTNWDSELMEWMTCDATTYVPDTLTLAGASMPSAFALDTNQIMALSSFYLRGDEVWGVEFTTTGIQITGDELNNGYEPDYATYPVMALEFYDSPDQIDPFNYAPQAFNHLPRYTDVNPLDPTTLTTVEAQAPFSLSTHLPMIVEQRLALIADIESLGGTADDVKDTKAMVFEDGKLHVATPVAERYKEQVTAEQHTVVDP